KIILFAEKIRVEFRKYIGGQEDVSISGGIVIFGEKFPIRMAANYAGNAEDKSKDFELDNKKKNALTFFSETISWGDEFEEVKNVKELFIVLCDKDKMPISKALLHQIMRWKQQNDAY